MRRTQIELRTPLGRSVSEIARVSAAGTNSTQGAFVSIRSLPA
jgi:hypothetical protein